MCYIPRMRTKRAFRVLALISLSSAAGRKKHYGVNKFLSEGWWWDVELLRSDYEFTRDRLRTELGKGYDGLLILLPRVREFLDILSESELPMSFTDTPDRDILRRLPYGFFVHDDAKDIVRTAMEHLLSCRNIRCIGLVPTRQPTPWSMEREAAFRSIASRYNDIKSQVFTGDGTSNEQMADWMRSLPKPAGIVTMYDDRAKDVLMAARECGFRVPEDVSVIGIGNDEPICEMTNPPLTSVSIDFTAEGYRAARELQAMMLKRMSPTKRDVLIGSSGVIRRNSTSAPIDNAAIVRRALKFIHEHAMEGIDVKDVVCHMRVSRRLADLRFSEVAGCTILNAILARRIDEAKRLLSNGDMRITEVALRCGYQNANYFKNVFRRLTGLSPRAWRNLNGRNQVSRK